MSNRAKPGTGSSQKQSGQTAIEHMTSLQKRMESTFSKLSSLRQPTRIQGELGDSDRLDYFHLTHERLEVCEQLEELMREYKGFGVSAHLKVSGPDVYLDAETVGKVTEGYRKELGELLDAEPVTAEEGMEFWTVLGKEGREETLVADHGSGAEAGNGQGFVGEAKNRARGKSEGEP
ncbi:hypothetical protein B0A55_00700 [Friedmanniomyces simplex]|uniref:Uncharacterized protein n=1 Tax=Friedmanniomyces simplex TaxID=329884 RepID=A0A4U0XYQ6_9PEZI|nr:hypothetical protein B0A55_00700 [Friedmanniomyces simplex]